MRRIRALALAVVLACAAACGGSGGAAGAADGGRVTLRVGDQKGTGMQALLEASGQLENLPYEIEWSQFTSGPPMLEAVNAGSLDLGTVGNAPPVFAAAAGSKITIIGVSEKGLGGQAVVVPSGSAITTVAALKGKKIAVAKGSSANFHLLAVLKKNGLSFTDVSPQYLQPSDALAALSTGRVDAWAIWDPYTAQAQHQIGARILADATGYANGFEFQIAATDALDEPARAKALGDFVARVRRAHTWANDHPTQWGEVYARLTGLPQDVIAMAVPRNRYTDLELDADVIAREQQVADAFAEAGLIPGTVRIADITDPRYNEGAQ
ncbi:ABC transporter substrate-binding protein [Nonomuraea aridisoli]|uniref:Putative aliphatic sulfonates-binding protein n=1 Tax=Nonomuraea aridisoli TaxID=2070368 RepID=A0A2W2EYL6_9ACTN|nr:ABC transporter substrate-binding protein [Nonomuraea aridisoli]PZG14447.1 ABC transporter substrate-binding protein [Nonomuraea aridisoli]